MQLMDKECIKSNCTYSSKTSCLFCFQDDIIVSSFVYVILRTASSKYSQRVQQGMQQSHFWTQLALITLKS